MLCGSEADKVLDGGLRLEFIVLALPLFVAGTRDGVFMSNTANLHMVADDMRVLVTMPDRLDR